MALPNREQRWPVRGVALWVDTAKPLDHYLAPSPAAGFPKKSRTSLQELSVLNAQGSCLEVSTNHILMARLQLLSEGGSEGCISVSATGGILTFFKQMTNDQTQYFEKQKETVRLIELSIASEYINIYMAISLFTFVTPYPNLHTYIWLVNICNIFFI